MNLTFKITLNNMPNKQKEKPFDWEGGLDKHIKNSIEVYGCNFHNEKSKQGR